MFKRFLHIVLILIFLCALFLPTAYASENLTGASAPAYYKAASSTLNMRAAPKSAAKVVETFKKGAVVLRVDNKKYSGSGLKWYKVRSLVTGKTGYVCTKYISKTAKPNYSRLHQLSVDTGALRPAFSPNTLKYDYYLSDSKTSFTLSYTALITAAAQVKIGDIALMGNPVAVAFEAGKKLTLTVAGQGKTTVYTINMKREGASASKLSGVALSGVSLSPAFDADTLSYTASVPYKTLDTTAAVKKGKYSTVNYYLNGKKNPDNYFPLMVGENNIAVECVSPLKQKTVYNIKITRAKPAAGEKIRMSGLERRFVETAFSLLPARHPFVLAYEEATGRDIKTYTVTKKGVKLSGVPFEFGGGGAVTGFYSRWWNRTGVKRYPAGGMDCAE